MLPPCSNTLPLVCPNGKALSNIIHGVCNGETGAWRGGPFCAFAQLCNSSAHMLSAAAHWALGAQGVTPQFDCPVLMRPRPLLLPRFAGKWDCLKQEPPFPDPVWAPWAGP